MIKISHEMPLSMLRDGSEYKFNDYGYALVHLFEENREYYDYYVKSLKDGRTVYLDNSIFELETAFDADRFVYWLRRLNADSGSSKIVYIVPDVLDDTEGTLSNMYSFLDKYPSLPGRRMTVAQGKSIEDLVDCYNILSKASDVVGVSFNCLAYENLFEGRNLPKLETWVRGRHFFLETLYNLGHIQPNLHLLGCGLPQEFKYYTVDHSELSKYILSIDTSNPVVHGIEGIKYTEEGLSSKSSIKLYTLLNYDLSNEDKQLIESNILAFRRINKI